MIALVLLAFCSASSLAAADDAEPLSIGLAVVDVTPPIGHRMSGYFYERLSTGTANPLQARAIVFKQGSEQFAWVFCDLVGVPASLTSQVREAAEAATGIPVEKIVIAATHSHTGPLYFGALRDYFHEQAIAKTGVDEHEAIDYSAELEKKLVEAIAAASQSMQPAEVAASFATQRDLAFNRRYFMKNGSVITNPGKLNPDIDRPAGPTDVELGLLQFRRDGKPFAGLTVFGLHLDTTDGTEYAADFPFYLERDLRRTFGSQYISIFGIGPCGDVNHFDVSHDRPQKSHEEAERIGATIAATALKSLETAVPLGKPELNSSYQRIEVPFQQFTAAEIAAAKENLSKVGTRELPIMEQVAAVKIVGVNDYGVRSLPVDVQAFCLSDSLAVVALPGELFTELGLAIKQRSPFAKTLVLELCNDYPGYIPTRRGYIEGGYEPTYSKLEPGGGEQMVDAAVALLRELKGTEK
ncbi:hypothetical protein PLANPX_2405 [Lacipirellula parvula]|uniref:Neutral/alkaline non-lysosomal ceramidase N-terminal domain-containing protein n=1 Tax=Lacipirellula parvula TaxID=2650471 RepID=A0A5K7XEY6_9BACT|nr:hypothetical protein PLANPX_2405 [Lacipirellula parvula]